MTDTPVRIRQDLYTKLEKLAAAEKRSIKKQLEHMLEAAL